jgi:hypothetical protein
MRESMEKDISSHGRTHTLLMLRRIGWEVAIIAGSVAWTLSAWRPVLRMILSRGVLLKVKSEILYL